MHINCCKHFINRCRYFSISTRTYQYRFKTNIDASLSLSILRLDRKQQRECARRIISPEVPETVKEPPLAIETRQGHEGADPRRALARIARLVFLFAAKIARTVREKEKSRRNRHCVPHNNSRKIFLPPLSF